MVEFLYFITYSVVGWIYETILCSVREKRFINRGFLNGPYCPIYGCGAMLDIFLLKPFAGNIVALFFLSMVVCSALEYATSYILEKLFKSRWWDYSNNKFNLNGRICLLGAVVFGAMSVLLVKLLHPVVVDFFSRFSDFTVHIAADIILFAFLCDNIITFAGFCGFNKRLKELSDTLKQKAEAASEAFAEKRKIDAAGKSRPLGLKAVSSRRLLKKISFQQRRMVRSFPAFKSLDYNAAVEELRRLFDKTKRGDGGGDADRAEKPDDARRED